MQSASDRRRVNGPEESFAPVFDELDDDDLKVLSRKGRSLKDIRPIFLQPGLIGQANGSAYVEVEKTKIACAVYGPRQSKNTAYSDHGRLNVEVKFAPFSCERRRQPLRDAEDRSIAVAIHQALVASVRLDLLPKSTIDVFINIIEADGIEGCIASGSVAASTALADAGIDMLGLVVACSAAVIDGEIWLDPTAEETHHSTGTLVLSTLPSLDTSTSIWQTGQLSPVQVLEGMALCEDRCKDVHSIVAHALRQNAS